MCQAASFFAILLIFHSFLLGAENPFEEPKPASQEFPYVLTIEADFYEEHPLPILINPQPKAKPAGVLPAGTKLNVIENMNSFLKVDTEDGRRIYISGDGLRRRTGEAFEEIPEVFQVAHSSNGFAFDLYRKLRESSNQLVFSPVNLSTAMAMAYAGAEGETKRQIASVLHLNELRVGSAEDPILVGFGGLAATLSSDGPGYQLHAANRLFVHAGKPLRPQFLLLTRETYSAEAHPLDFAQPDEARRQINQWVARETAGKISELIPSGLLNEDSRVVLATAVHLAAKWRKPFPKADTKPEPFQLDNGREVTVPTMHLNDARLNYAEEDGVKILQLPYSNGEGIDLSMLLVLPDTPAGWAELDRRLSSKLLNKWESKLDARIVDVSFPRFRIQSPAQLAGSLTDLGMPLAFDTAQADFSGVSSEPLFLREVVHEAFISVDEEGTEAAAATGPVMEFLSAPPPATFKADRPFLFLIRDHRTSAILFLGRVENPNSTADN